ncbi:hypothetical protein DM02DRAFT_700242 [Periconia macrospinosa]|uniref:CR-type domain-containing protein n=1 Tax=Periconia macrospinosa TaxID=97972 RepID=A0A2V1D2Y1_9PLEO|nr:hypothetical protein DM02DRAFT_700242 [Periconia macrospinosa]
MSNLEVAYELATLDQITQDFGSSNTEGVTPTQGAPHQRQNFKLFKDKTFSNQSAVKHVGDLEKKRFWGPCVIVKDPVPMRPIVGYLEITSDEIGKVATKTLEIDVEVICIDCEGSGALNGQEGFVPCWTCRKHPGFVWRSHSFGPPFAPEGHNEEWWRPCENCNGTGKFVKWKCRRCDGKKMCHKTFVFKVPILPMVKAKDLYIFHGEGNQSLESRYTNGDVVIRYVVDGIGGGEFDIPGDQWISRDTEAKITKFFQRF